MSFELLERGMLEVSEDCISRIVGNSLSLKILLSSSNTLDLVRCEPWAGPGCVPIEIVDARDDS